jgi:hypothetical protein
MQIFRKNFSISKIFTRKPILLISIFLHLISLVCSLVFNNSLGFVNNNKFAEAPFNFLWEWVTVFWCVWSSILTCVYNYTELKGDYKKASWSKKRQEKFSLIVAVGNLISILIFTTYLPDQLSKDIPRGLFWWIYSFVWHYIAFPLSLFYFCKFVKTEEKTVYRRKIFWLLAFQPFIFLLVNLFRAKTAEPTYLTKKSWKKFLVPQFEWIEKGELLKFLLFFLLGVVVFWLALYMLIKIKKRYFPRTVINQPLAKNRKTKKIKIKKINY